jgi:hypothetical protein
MGGSNGSITWRQAGRRTPIASSGTRALFDIDWSPDGNEFAAVTQQRDLVLWDAATCTNAPSCADTPEP